MAFFSYGKPEMEHLKARDEKLGAVIDKVGFIRRETDADIFSQLVLSVLSQQISNKAFETVKRRFTDKVGIINEENVMRIGIDGIRECGISGRKAENIYAIAKSSLDGELDLKGLSKLPDGEVIKCLTKLKGIGIWTAEMILIFCLERKNVLSFGDFGIKRGIMLLYGEADLTKAQFEEYRERYSPYATVAAFYLWKIGNGEVVLPVNE